MFGFLMRWLDHRKRIRSAIAMAVRQFESKTGERAHRSICDVIAEEPEQFVVRVCYGQAKPPCRAWYLISAEGSIVCDLSFEEAQQFGERLWR